MSAEHWSARQPAGRHDAILAVSATGRLGGAMTQALVAQGRSVRILARQNSPWVDLAKQRLATPAEVLISAGAQPVGGALKDRASLDTACAGIETVVATANAVRRGDKDNLTSYVIERKWFNNGC